MDNNIKLLSLIFREAGGPSQNFPRHNFVTPSHNFVTLSHNFVTPSHKMT